MLRPKPSKKRGAPEPAENASLRKLRRNASEAPKVEKEPVMVKVGEKEVTFRMRKDLLVAHSDFFKAALGHEWKEKKEHTIWLPDSDPAIFEIFYHFVGTGTMFTKQDGDRSETQPEGEFWDHEWSRLMDVWLLGDKLLSTPLRDAATDTLIAKMLEDAQYPVWLHRTIYKGGTATSSVRKLAVDLALWEWPDMTLCSLNDENGVIELAKHHPAFLADLAMAMAKTREKGRTKLVPWKDDSKPCYYHDHVAEGKPCYKTMFD